MIKSKRGIQQWTRWEMTWWMRNLARPIFSCNILCVDCVRCECISLEWLLNIALCKCMCGIEYITYFILERYFPYYKASQNNTKYVQSQVWVIMRVVQSGHISNKMNDRYIWHVYVSGEIIIGRGRCLKSICIFAAILKLYFLHWWSLNRRIYLTRNIAVLIS